MPPTSSSRRRVFILLMLIVVLGLAVRVYRIREQSLWIDDMANGYAYLGAPNLAMHLALVHSVTSEMAPVYIAVQYYLAHLIGEDPVRLRFFSITLGTLSIVLIFLIGQHMFNPQAGLIAALLLACSPVHIWYSQALRPQALLFCLLLLSIYCFLRGIDGRRTWWIPAFLANGLIVYTHHMYILFPAVEMCAAAFIARRHLRRAIPLMLFQTILLVPFILYVSNLRKSYFALYQQTLQPWSIVESLTASTCRDYGAGIPFWCAAMPLPFQEAATDIYGFSVFLASVMLTISVIWYFVSYVGKPVKWNDLLFTGLIIVLPVITFTVMTCMMHKAALQPRYFFYSLLVRMVILGGFFAAVRLVMLRKAVGCLLVMLCSYQLLYAVPNTSRPDWRSVAAYIKRTGSPGEAVIATSIADATYFNYYNRGAGRRPTFWAFNLRSAAETAQTVLLRSQPEPLGAVWYIYNQDYRKAVPAPFEQLLRARGLSFERTNFPGNICIVLYRVTKGTLPARVAEAAAVDIEQDRAFVNANLWPEKLQREETDMVRWVRHEHLLSRLMRHGLQLKEDYLPWERFLVLILAQYRELDLAESMVDISESPFLGGREFAEILLRSLKGDEAGARTLFERLKPDAKLPAFLLNWLKVFAIDRDYRAAHEEALCLEKLGFLGGASLRSLSRTLIPPTPPKLPVGLLALEEEDETTVFGTALEGVADIPAQMAGDREKSSHELQFLTDLAEAQFNAGDVKAATDSLVKTKALSTTEQEGAAGPIAEVMRAVLASKEINPRFLRACQGVLGLFPQDADLLFLSGRLAERQNDVPGAIRAYESAAQYEQAPAQAYLALAAVQEKAGHNDEALAAYRRVQSLEPGQAGAFVGEGRLLGARADWQGAAAAYRKAIVVEPGNSATYRALGAALASQGDKEGQLATLLQAEAVDPHDPLTLSQEAEALEAKADVDNALAKLRQVIELRPDDAAAYFHLGSLYARKSAWEPALEALRKSYDLEPARIAALTAQGPVLESQGNLEGAAAVYRKASALSPGDPAVKTQLAAVLLHAGDASGALGVVETALKESPDDTVLLNQAGALFEQEGKIELEVRLLRAMAERRPDDAGLRTRLAQSLDRQGDAAGALEAYRAAATLEPSGGSALITHGDLLGQHGDGQGAVAAYRTAIELQPDNAEAYERLASALEKQRAFDAAVEALCALAARVPGKREFLIQQAAVLESMGAAEPAARVYRTVLERVPDDRATWLLLGGALAHNKDWAGALNAYRTAEKLDAQNIEAYLGEAQVLEEQKDDAGAVTAYHAAIALKPDDAALLDQVAFRLEQHKDLEGALAAFRRVQALDLTRIDALAGEARILSAKRDWKEAEAAYRKAIERQPSDPSLWANLGHVQQQLKNLPDALDAFQHARTLNASDSASWMSEGTILFDRGNFPDAIAAFKKVTELQPQNLPAWLCLGEVSNRAGQREEALKIFRHAIEIDRNSVLGLHAAGRLAANLGHADEAAAYCEQALVIDQQDQDARLLLGELAVQRHDFAAAFRQYAALLETNPGNDLALGMAVNALEQHPEAAGAARALSDHLLEARPEDPQVHYLAGLVREGQHDFPEALAHFQKCAEANMPKPKPNLHMGRIYEVRHDVAAAIQSYRKALACDPQNHEAQEHIQQLLPNGPAAPKP